MRVLFLSEYVDFMFISSTIKFLNRTEQIDTTFEAMAPFYRWKALII